MRKWWILAVLILLGVVAIWLLRADETPPVLTADDAINTAGELNQVDETP